MLESLSEWFVSPPKTYLAIFLSALGIYITLIIFTRLAGKRSFSKMSSFDFAMTVAVGSLIASTVLSKNVSLVQGIAGLASLYIIQISVAILRRFEWVKNLVDNKPLLLMDGSNILHDNLKKARVSEGDLRSKLRESNVLSLDQVRAVVFETTGDVSVLKASEKTQTLDNYLVKDVLR
jgi:uncharacterized membrane protein YcaP (DUF421 family)